MVVVEPLTLAELELVCYKRYLVRYWDVAGRLPADVLATSPAPLGFGAWKRQWDFDMLLFEMDAGWR